MVESGWETVNLKSTNESITDNENNGWDTVELKSGDALKPVSGLQNRLQKIENSVLGKPLAFASDLLFGMTPAKSVTRHDNRMYDYKAKGLGKGEIFARETLESLKEGAGVATRVLGMVYNPSSSVSKGLISTAIVPALKLAGVAGASTLIEDLLKDNTIEQSLKDAKSSAMFVGGLSAGIPIVGKAIMKTSEISGKAVTPLLTKLANKKILSEEAIQEIHNIKRSELFLSQENSDVINGIDDAIKNNNLEQAAQLQALKKDNDDKLLELANKKQLFTGEDANISGAKDAYSKSLEELKQLYDSVKENGIIKNKQLVKQVENAKEKKIVDIEKMIKDKNRQMEDAQIEFSTKLVGSTEKARKVLSKEYDTLLSDTTRNNNLSKQLTSLYNDITGTSKNNPDGVIRSLKKTPDGKISNFFENYIKPNVNLNDDEAKSIDDIIASIKTGNMNKFTDKEIHNIKLALNNYYSSIEKVPAERFVAGRIKQTINEISDILSKKPYGNDYIDLNRRYSKIYEARQLAGHYLKEGYNRNYIISDSREIFFKKLEKKIKERGVNDLVNGEVEKYSEQAYTLALQAKLLESAGLVPDSKYIYDSIDDIAKQIFDIDNIAKELDIIKAIDISKTKNILGDQLANKLKKLETKENILKKNISNIDSTIKQVEESISELKDNSKENIVKLRESFKAKNDNLTALKEQKQRELASIKQENDIKILNLNDNIRKKGSVSIIELNTSLVGLTFLISSFIPNENLKNLTRLVVSGYALKRSYPELAYAGLKTMDWLGSKIANSKMPEEKKKLAILLLNKVRESYNKTDEQRDIEMDNPFVPEQPAN